ncbi:MAG: hypothetical protein KC496_13800 [Anaerolineae bacterium]|nr:hypothetical protein [Anaerolineae bacterium]
MSAADFVTTFMRFAQRITHAERGLALDPAMQVFESVNLPESILTDQGFFEMTEAAVRDAQAEGKPVLTNNLMRQTVSPLQTNEHFPALRLALVIPLGDHGAVYLDKLVRNGVFERDEVDRLEKLVVQIQDSARTDFTEEEIDQLYDNLN